LSHQGWLVDSCTSDLQNPGKTLAHGHLWETIAKRYQTWETDAIQHTQGRNRRMIYTRTTNGEQSGKSRIATVNLTALLQRPLPGITGKCVPRVACSNTRVAGKHIVSWDLGPGTGTTKRLYLGPDPHTTAHEVESTTRGPSRRSCANSRGPSWCESEQTFPGDHLYYG
jgi:hypothetical protein